MFFIKIIVFITNMVPNTREVKNRKNMEISRKVAVHYHLGPFWDPFGTSPEHPVCPSFGPSVLSLQNTNAMRTRVPQQSV